MGIAKLIRQVATSRETYIAAWSRHIPELIHPFCDADMDIEEFNKLEAQLMEVVTEAANKSFPDALTGPPSVTKIVGETEKKEYASRSEMRRVEHQRSNKLQRTE